MAFHGALQSLRSLSRGPSTRYSFPYLPSPISSSHFSALYAQSNSLHDDRPINNQSTPHERFVLDQLSNLLPVPLNNSAPKQLEPSNSEKPINVRAPDGFLLPDEKLRGVFLQKLRGTTAIEHALDNVGVDLSVDVVAQVVNRGNLSSEAMLMFFNWVIKKPAIAKDIHTYHIILKALGRRKFFTHMMHILHNMRARGISPDLETISIVMDSFVRAGYVSKAIQVFRNLEEVGLDCDTKSLNMLVQCLCQRSHVGAANSFLNSVKGKIQFNGTTYNIVIGGWSRNGRVSEMERILEVMVADGFSPDNSTFSFIIEGLGRAGRIDDAVEIFDSMKTKGCVPDARAYNAMISNFISVRGFDECLKYYKGMPSNNCDPNIDTYTKLIDAFLKARKVADALEMFDEMLGRGFLPSTGTLTSFIEPLCNYGPPYAAMMIYQKARKVGCRVSLSAYKLLLMRLSRFGKCGMLLSIWEDMQECGYGSDMEVYDYIINGFCNNGQLESAVLVMEESVQKGFCPTRLSYSKLNNKLLASNKVERAYRLFLKVKDARRYDTAQRFWRAKGWHF
ncbi:putative pentatricopeptide repeat-containing protein At5g43820 [Pyrus x bretschneideri]|uniref:putative pentatricopeptide repeat-containing protein At5g43820 n=1 Tax=Pyrus x bretschneideri TaxID=225117 RepID=UPI00202FCCFC|nr:putative pentatricopeptide repeat-containing protein At5g43820 [Pyrus x bretschneideri]